MLNIAYFIIVSLMCIFCVWSSASVCVNNRQVRVKSSIKKLDCPTCSCEIGTLLTLLPAQMEFDFPGRGYLLVKFENTIGKFEIFPDARKPSRPNRKPILSLLLFKNQAVA